MSLDVVKYAFASGEISSTMLGRTDLEKYDLSVAECENFFVDYRGGLSNSPGTRFVDLVQSDWLDTKFVPFKFAPAVTSTYVLLFGSGYIRFIQDGAYILESAKNISALTRANPGVVTATGHGYANGDLVKIFDVVGMVQVNAQTYVVGNKTTNTFELHKLDQAVSGVDTSGFTAYASGGHVYRVYTVASSYATTDLALLKIHQARSVLYITHDAYAPQKLTRVTDTNWTLAGLSIAPNLSTPTGLTLTPSSAGTAGVAFAVTAVDQFGSESQVSAYAFNALSVNYATTAGSMKLTWTAVANAQYYKVYRSQIIPVGADLTRAMEVGLVGVAYGPDFTDNNIIPDFTIAPPVYDNPFANGAIQYINVTAGGTGYTRASVVSASGGGSGFVAYPVVSAAGVLLAIVIVNGGSGYSSPTIAVTVGTGATFSTTLSGATGNNPRVSSVYQQRKIYAGTDNNPLTIDGSQPGLYEVFDDSSVIVDSDAYEFELDSEEVAPIIWLTPTRAGLVLWTQAGLWQLTGGTDSSAITPLNALALPQSYAGIQEAVPPLTVDTDIVYAEAKGNRVRLLTYNNLTQVYAGQDLSVLANHLITPDNKIVDWSYASDPFNIVYAVREDGVLLCLALVKEQNVFGWSRRRTRGRFYDVLVMQESSVDVPYVMVERHFDGRWAKVIEQIVPRFFDTVEDSWFLDCALNLTPNTPATGLVIPECAIGDTVTGVADAAVFSSGQVGYIVRGGGGKFEVSGYTDSKDVSLLCITPCTKLIPELPVGTSECRLDSGKWSIDPEVTTISGLNAYNGLTVSILADGNVLPDQVVANGQVVLANAASRVIVGLSYRALIKTLPPEVQGQALEGRLKRPVAVRARVDSSRGLKAGPDLDNLTEAKDRSTEAYGEPTRLQTGVKEIGLNGGYDYDGQLYLVQDYPLPLTVLSFVTPMELGDGDGD